METTYFKPMVSGRKNMSKIAANIQMIEATNAGIKYGNS